MKSGREGKAAGRRYSIRVQFTIIFLLLMLGTIGLCWIINNTFLEKYYLREKRIALTEMYKKVNSAAANNTIDSEEFDEEVMRSAGKDSISLIVMDAESSMVKLHASDSESMGRRMWDNLFGETPDLSERDSAKSRYYIADCLADQENYQINIIYDSRMNTKTMELFGVLDDGSFCLLQSAVESIHNSSAIANRFMGYIGIAVSLLGALIALLLAGKITEPIRELTEISARMKKLDFSAKYRGNSRTEIAELGDNINELSEILERTISELKTANNELREDIEKKEKLEDMRQEFLSNVTHELKTPLALIKGYAEGLSEGVADDPDSIRFYTEVITDEADKMNRFQRDRYMTEVQKHLFADFEGALRHMTISQGGVLLKLIDRETSQASYSIIKEYKNGIAAAFWQGVAKIFDNDLKSQYDPEGADRDLEELVQMWKNGTFKRLYWSIFWEDPPEVKVPDYYKGD